jgi:hypothetical protein
MVGGRGGAARGCAPKQTDTSRVRTPLRESVFRNTRCSALCHAVVVVRSVRHDSDAILFHTRFSNGSRRSDGLDEV